jgi:predicted GNAT family N-acyltransferase
MVNINKHETALKFQQLFQQQKSNLERLDKVFLLDKLIETVLSYNKKINFESDHKNLQIVSSAEELVQVYRLRSEIYGNLGYQNEFPDYLPNMNFDSYDENAAILFTKHNNEITSTCRLIFDSTQKLPIEEKLNLSGIRDKFPKIAEISRLMVKKESGGLSLDFKYLMAGMYYLKRQNNVDASASVFLQDHFKLYDKLGGFVIEKTLQSYGHLNKPFVISSWNPLNISKFFQRAFLKI